MSRRYARVNGEHFGRAGRVKVEVSSERSGPHGVSG